MFDIPDTGPNGVPALMKRFDLSIVALTRGAEGSELFVGGDRFWTEAPKPAKIADTVGAGDAYTAMLATGLLKRWPPERILSAAARFSCRICSIEGAIPDSDDFYRDFRAEMKGPADA